LFGGRQEGGEIGLRGQQSQNGQDCLRSGDLLRIGSLLFQLLLEQRLREDADFHVLAELKPPGLLDKCR
jgi:hypothetical protein